MAVVFVGAVAAGLGDGSTPGDKMAYTALDAAVQAAGPGGEVRFLPTDVYQYNKGGAILLSHGGLPGAPVRITSADQAVPVEIRSDRTAVWPAWPGPGFPFPTVKTGSVVFRLDAGTQYLVWDHFDWRDVGFCILLNTAVRDLTVRDMVGRNVRSIVRVTGPGNILSGTFQRIYGYGYTKGPIAIQGSVGSSDLLFEDIGGDSQFQDGDGITVGLAFGGNTPASANRNITIRRVDFRNHVNLYDPTEPTFARQYVQGDGITTEEYDDDITIEGGYAATMGDSFLDMKADGVTASGLVAVGCKRSFRKHPSGGPSNTHRSTTLALHDCSSFEPRSWGGIGAAAHIQATDDVRSHGGTFVAAASDLAYVTFIESSFGFTGRVRLHGGTIQRRPTSPPLGAGLSLDRFVEVRDVGLRP